MNDAFPGRLIAVAGPSGVGKSTIVRRVLELDPAIWLSVSATTRLPRPGERHGIDYLFLTPAEFAELRGHDGLVESAEFAGNWYGTPRQPVTEQLAAGRNVLLEIEVQGVRQIRRAMPEATTVFLKPPSWEVLERRLAGRGTDRPESIARRLETAKAELAAAGEFDHIIVNTDVDDSARQLLAWVHAPA